ncbi:MAG TPA: EAL domain-containing response regulator [Steroidobacteraceae bacterium]|nr:EAL domain-containing response regulator [Steroidobacteraceae bacterium]
MPEGRPGVANTTMASNVLQSIDSVLIVDDSGVQRGIGVALCRELRIPKVHEAGNGLEALALLDKLSSPPALLIIDLEMPAMDGPELLSALGGRGMRAPIVLASSRERALMNSVQDMGTALGLRIVGALQKPLTLASLAALLQNKLDATVEKKGPTRRQLVDPDTLRAALARGDITVHYHPQVEIDTGLVRGVEALARWYDADQGWIAPDAFIPVAEQNGLIRELTLHVMDAAMRQTALWNRHGLDLSIAINLSPILLERGELVQEISELQQQHGLRAEQIVLEVTESSLLRDLAIALGVLTRLRLRGFRLSLDDYGTGFSSMQQLARIPFTELKIDRTFVHGAHERDSLQVILRSALELAGQLGIETVAEGVECLQDWRLLRQYGCKLAQGWLLAKAMPGAELEGWLPSLQRRRPELQA